MFILYSPRGQGWLTRSAQYSSDRSQAKEFSPEEALETCITYYRASRPLLPVRIDDWNHIQRLANDQR